ncbi:MAG TPA: LysM peptidoglycan-binding domain-containing protein [Caulobacteraceae bacterium]|jgi:murein DD-endopeptidase MepM/ murein hydrolase activator NlpD
MKSYLAAVSALALCVGLSACGDFPTPAYPVSQPVYAPPEPPAPPDLPSRSAEPPPAAEPDAPVARPSAPVGTSTLPDAPATRTRPGAYLDRSLDLGRPPLALAVWAGGDDTEVYPAARRRHHNTAAKPYPAAADDTVKVGKGDTLATIAKAHGSTVEALAKLNGLKSPYRLTAGQSLKLPGSAASDQTTAKASTRDKAAPKEESADAGAVKVGKGDTLATIAKAHGSTVEDLAKLNGLKSPYRLTAGQSLKLPGAGASEEAAAETPSQGKAKASKTASAPSEVTVAKGESLASIARKTGVSVDELAKLNGLPKSYKPQPGEVLRLKAEEDAASDKAPSAAASKSSTSKTKVAAKALAADEDQGDSTSTITVRRRDTIQSLAKQAHVSVAELARLNHLKKPYRLKPGQRVELPDQIGAVARGSAPSRAEPTRATPAEDERSAGPTSVTAGRRDTLKGIADKHGVSVETLATLNHLKKPYRIHRGQKIKLPAAPVEERAAPQQRVAEGGSYRVKSGDTLYSIARSHGTDARSLADLNGMSQSERLTVGRRIRLPGGADDKLAARPNRIVTAEPPTKPVPYAALPTNPPVAPAPGLAPPPVLPPPSATASSVPPPTSTLPSTAPPASAPSSSALANATPYRPTAPAPEPTTPGDAEVAAAGKGLFLWPVKGDVLQKFGPATGGQRNDGVDISGVSGDPVVAAAAGEVVYAGNSVPGFGNLVLIRHDGGWVTAYAHLKSLDVKMRQTVTQGQEIGMVGQTGGVGQPQLHFEVRYAPSTRDKARPIDPMLVLPQLN